MNQTTPVCQMFILDITRMGCHEYKWPPDGWGGVWFTRLCMYAFTYAAACWCRVKLVCTRPRQGNSPEHCFASITHDGEKICVDQTQTQAFKPVSLHVLLSSLSYKSFRVRYSTQCATNNNSTDVFLFNQKRRLRRLYYVVPGHVQDT